MKYPETLSNDLDRWENEGGGRPALGAQVGGGTLNMPVSGRPVEYAARKNVKSLRDLDAAGGFGEAVTGSHRRSMATLIKANLVNRINYPSGLVIYEITEAGRKFARDLRS